MNSLQKSQLIVKLRPGVYQMPAGELVGFGPLHPGGNGFCYNCSEPECIHVEAITQAWLDGMSVEAQSGTFNGYHTPSTVTAPPFTLLEVSAADIQAVNDGHRPGAWRVRNREELPSGWPMAQVK